MSAFTLNYASVNAYNGDSIIEPDVACYPDLGCLETVIYGQVIDMNTQFFDQTQTNSGWYYDHMYSSANVMCQYILGISGCAVASQATIATEFLNTLVTPSYINTHVISSCSYYGQDFEDLYTLDIGWYTHKSINALTKQEIINYFGPLVWEGKLIIMRSNGKDKDTGLELSSGHYEVIDGFKADVYYYEYGTRVVNYTELYMNDSANRDATLTAFLARYPFQKFGDVFTDLR
jgi:hypothetical protein